MESKMKRKMIPLTSMNKKQASNDLKDPSIRRRITSVLNKRRDSLLNQKRRSTLKNEYQQQEL